MGVRARPCWPERNGIGQASDSAGVHTDTGREQGIAEVPIGLPTSRDGKTYMKRMRRKDQFIDIVGEWDGTDTGEVALWLTEHGYVFGIQTEDEEQVGWRGKVAEEGEEIKPRTQLVVIGKRMYDETQLAPGQTLVKFDGRLAGFDTDRLNEDYEDI